MKDDDRPVAGPSCCPVCRARFRGSSLCSRCGADLTALMLLAAHAYVLRQSGRQSLRQGDYRGALACSQAAQRLHATPEGNLLSLLCTAAVHPTSGQWKKPGVRA
jgi:predicted amidophosphoribosyltransferase